MFTQFKSLPALFDHFSTDEICVNYLEQHRWNGKVICPHCGSEKFYRTVKVKKDGSKVNQYKCGTNTCYKKFSVTVGTIFEASKIPLRLWFGAIYIATTHRKGISSLQLARDLQITQKSAWFMMHRIREMLKDRKPKYLAGVVEIDESYIGGKRGNKSVSIRKKLNANPSNPTSGKAGVMGILERGGKVKVRTIDKASASTLYPIIGELVERGSTVVTDGHPAYKLLANDSNKFTHHVVDHSNDIYVTGAGFHTNSIEGFWSQLKRQIYGIHHFVTAKHLQRYCDESAFRWNLRELKDFERLPIALGQCAGRLKYSTLIEKK